ncbi:hypothetical protein HK103_006644 [Boothiomyces macroporosus]|uniref:Uncharacterized protein n=1 Tax=Boothiomyces macroporosus TaxID=261099 RepID=A0AAD5Y6Y5_9FUNG|nr:hypothetical protein HK103_006644 [Boothiomyces macroporosus]
MDSASRNSSKSRRPSFNWLAGSQRQSLVESPNSQRLSSGKKIPEPIQSESELSATNANGNGLPAITLTDPSNGMSLPATANKGLEDYEDEEDDIVPERIIVPLKKEESESSSDSSSSDEEPLAPVPIITTRRASIRWDQNVLIQSIPDLDKQKLTKVSSENNSIKDLLSTMPRSGSGIKKSASTNQILQSESPEPEPPVKRRASLFRSKSGENEMITRGPSIPHLETIHSNSNINLNTSSSGSGGKSDSDIKGPSDLELEQPSTSSELKPISNEHLSPFPRSSAVQWSEEDGAASPAQYSRPRNVKSRSSSMKSVQRPGGSGRDILDFDDDVKAPKAEPKDKASKLLALAKAESEMELSKGKSLNPIIAYFLRLKAQFIEIYLEKVTYKMESILMLFSMVPFALLAIVLLYIDQIVFFNALYGLIFKIAIVLTGLIALHAATFVNQRHAYLECMNKVVKGTALVRDIWETTKGNGHNATLRNAALMFYGCLIASELSITVVGVSTPDTNGKGKTLPLTLSNLTVTEDPYNLVLYGLGGMYSCSNCVFYSGSDDWKFIPISFSQTELGKPSEHYLISQVQDMAAISIACMTLETPRSYTPNILVETDKYDYGLNAVIVKLLLTSQSDTSSAMVTRRCEIFLRAVSAEVGTYYSTNLVTNAKKTEIASINPVNSSSCYYLSDICVNDPIRSDLVYSLTQPLFANASITINKNFAVQASLFPNPGSSINDEYFADMLLLPISLMLIGVANQYYTIDVDVPTMNIDTAEILNINIGLKITTILISAFCIFFAILLIAIDLIKLNLASDILLRKLSKIIHPGQENLESISEFVAKTYNPCFDQDSWDLCKIRYGEDRRTVMDPLGKLIFGNKKDVVKFKPDRAYY